MSMATRTVLIAGMGISPAVLTEPAWALASGGLSTVRKHLYKM